MNAVERLRASLADRYRIERELGQGGMATVYLAHDVKHERRVALKVLRPDLAVILGAERFLKEIRLTANLQHPHILPLLDSGKVEVPAERDQPSILLYYVMPFIDGESLRDRLTREHQLAIEDALRIATEVADALGYAHDQGVIHRDIKPENILLYGGHALVADFGIALAASRSDGSSRITETGISLGTPAYMAPEQAMGERDLTPKADIYSLSCVLYEMLAGTPPFLGGSAQAIVAKVLTERAPLVTAMRETIPPHIAAAVHKGLARLPADRFASAAAFAQALGNSNATSGVLPMWSGTAPAFPSLAWFRRHWQVLALASALAVTLAVGAWGWLRSPAAARTMRFRVALPPDEGIALQAGPVIAIAPDGSRLVYAARAGSGVQLRIWSLDALTTDSVPGTMGAAEPAFSPDGRSIAFWARGYVKAVPLAGGPMLALADSASFLGVAWGPDGYVYYTRAAGTPGISRVSAAGGPPEVITAADTSRGEIDHRWVSVLPNGRGVLFTVWSGSTDRSDIAVMDLRSRQTRILFKGVFARYARSGRILFARNDRSLYSIAFDLSTLSVSGRETPLLRGLNVKVGGATDLTLSENGTFAYLTGEPPVEELEWVGRDGQRQPVDTLLRQYFTSLALSPDGSRIVTSYDNGSGEHLWLYDTAGHSLSRLTFDGVHNRRPMWSPDGSTITYTSDRSGQLTLWRIPTDGGGRPIRVLPAANDETVQESSRSPRSDWLVYRRGPGGSGSRDLMAIRPGADSVARPLLDSPFSESSPSLSPDGRWLAYVSDESGHPEVYVRTFPDPGGEWQVSVDGGIEPVWSHSGRELFYRRADGDLMAASVRQQPGFGVLARRRLFSTVAYASDRNHALFGVSPDDQHFLMAKVLRGTPGETDLGLAAQQLVMVLNWSEVSGPTRRNR